MSVMCDKTLDTYSSTCVCHWSRAMVNLLFDKAMGHESICFHENTVVNVRNTLFLKYVPCSQCGEIVPAKDLQVLIHPVTGLPIVPGSDE